ncbi:sensor histidine kinase [Tropicimonas sp. IMCC34043]|uniref:sensor histidine kinase n=1 Tax=Tropicimonas sp. IMCC34043 TaxID=2248760 RepID=UPI001E2E7A25|nr:sensor histidine kinase [Tropicimonas sp. IMCC34043]
MTTGSDTAPSLAPALRAVRSLSLRLAMLLSMALLPLGLIAVWQTTRLERELGELNARDLVALTAEVARQERETIESAIGAATALSAAVVNLDGEPERCRKVFESFLDTAGGRFTFAGFLPVSGTMTCSSLGKPVDLRQNKAFHELIADGVQTVSLNTHGPFSGQAVVVASVPVHDRQGALSGFVSISIPHRRVNSPYAEIIGGREVDLFTINNNGEVLTASGDLETAASRMPADRPASMLIGGPDRFVARNGNGQQRVFSVVPIVHDTVYAVGAWKPLRGMTGGPVVAFLRSPAMFPLIMWLASLVLIYMAVERQVVRHVRVLAGQMRQFGRTRELPSSAPAGHIPDEIAVIEREFGALASQLLQDEAELMDAMRDKDVLLKEVHHRVKNNLQLISSIVNMQARRTANPSTAAALENVNRRVISMATVHRRLYQAENLGRVRADELLHDVIAPLADLAAPGRQRPRIELSLDPVVLYPDQAVPAALLSVEAVTNALKYLGPDASGDSWLRVRLRDLGDGCLTLSVESSMTPGAAPQPPGESSEGGGLGSQLIRAFTRQLEAESEIIEGTDSYLLRLTFQAAAFEPTSDTTAPT